MIIKKTRKIYNIASILYYLLIRYKKNIALLAKKNFSYIMLYDIFMSDANDNKKVVYKAKKRDLSKKLKDTTYLTNAQKKILQLMNSNNEKKSSGINR